MDNDGHSQEKLVNNLFYGGTDFNQKELKGMNQYRRDVYNNVYSRARASEFNVTAQLTMNHQTMPNERNIHSTGNYINIKAKNNFIHEMVRVKDRFYRDGKLLGARNQPGGITGFFFQNTGMGNYQGWQA